ncbi:hypothetical protein AnigIFM63604_007848 [Aspergillus niger]|uniref:Cryptic loci regulator 2 N-terminal domain-containing protein n=1 Tax=Aspergillus niger TaxID=5061 RepID=A0A9W5ZSY7_ASPNG|nr:hypothetical protein AnigIFM63604_007848 [Aspergillus niger]
MVVIPINRAFSDGTQDNWPKDERFLRPDDSYYREKLASMWLQKTGAYERGVEYILDSLPDGYALFDRPRMANPDIVGFSRSTPKRIHIPNSLQYDRFLYGHPTDVYFNSTKQFFPHFYYLMTGGQEPCACVLCEKMSKRLQGFQCNADSNTQKVAQKSEVLEGLGGDLLELERLFEPLVGRRGGHLADLPDQAQAKPPEGHPDDHQEDPEDPLVGPLVDLLAGLQESFQDRRHALETDITEPGSMDWRAERSPLDEYIQKLDLQPSFLPRAGEIVLWTPDFEGELAWNPENNQIQIYFPSEKRWLGTPEWRAGIVSQVPEEDTIFQDIVQTSPKEQSINYSGFRVETFPDPHSPDKSYSLHYKYVYLKSIKPFNAYEHFLQNIPRENLHPSIEYAMTIMSSFSLLDKYHFKGVWPDASIYSRGIFIGAELLTVGDAVRLKPQNYNLNSPYSTPNPAVTDIMVIDEIRLDLKNCDSALRSKHLAEKYIVRIRGKVYTPSDRRIYLSSNTLHPIKPLTPDEVVSAFNYVGMSGYGDWYRMHPGASVDISQDMILGRLYEPDALQLMFGSLALGYDLQGVLRGRAYSRQADERIPEGQKWFWGDFRTQTLAIDSLNGEDVGHYSDARDVKMWRANLRVLDGVARPADFREAKIPGDVGRPSTKSRSNFAKVGKLSKLVSTGLGSADLSNPVSEVEEGTSRLSVGDDDDDEEEEESEEEEEDFTLRMDQLRGGTAETEEGDYMPDNERERERKRVRHDD